MFNSANQGVNEMYICQYLFFDTDYRKRQAKGAYSQESAASSTEEKGWFFTFSLLY
jgi:hypothetical protein